MSAMVPNNNNNNKKRIFRRKLIKLVRKRPILYDPAHSQFADIKAKEEAWNVIAKLMDHDVQSCQTIWMDLRHEYQHFARNLSQFFKDPNEKNRRRPAMLFSEDMHFLWGMIRKEKPQRKPADKRGTATAPTVTSIEGDSPTNEDPLQLQCEPPPLVISQVFSQNPQCNENGGVSLSPLLVPVEAAQPQPSEDDGDDDIMIVEESPVFIDLSEDGDPISMKFENTITITPEMLSLVELIKLNRELYDTEHTHYADYKRRSTIWNTIANELKEKATKLMKLWWLLQTRYEWELTRNAKYVKQYGKPPETTTQLESFLTFLEPYILKNPNTVCKQSFYLQDAWYEPIDNFKNIHNLVGALRKNPQVVNLTDALLTSKTKSDEFFRHWLEVAKYRGFDVGQCECTWLLLRSFYWELMQIRLQGYQLQDKWYFERFIADLYSDAKKLTLAGSPAAPSAVETPLPAPAVRPAPPMKPSVTAAAATPMGTLPPVKPVIMSHITAHQLADKQLQTQNGYRLTCIPKALNSPGKSVANNKLNADLRLTLPSLPPNLIITHHRVETSPASSASATATITTQSPNVLNSIVGSVAPVPAQNVVITTSTTTTTNTISLPSTLTMTHVPANYVQKKPRLRLPPNTSIRCTPVTINHLPPVTPLPTAVQTPPKTTIEGTTVAVAPLQQQHTVAAPKTTNTMSLLNPDEIMIELVSSVTGNQLVVHGPDWKFSLSMPTCTEFIRTIMAIPLLHNQYISTPHKVNPYWQYLANKFKMPQNVCKACWNFLADNFNHFPQIAPMDELMRPFKVPLKVWRETSLMTKFDSDAVSSGWMQYQPYLPQVMEEIGKNNAFYRSLAKHKQMRMPTAVPDDEWAAAQKAIEQKFPHIPGVLNIWTAFKNIYWRYLWELEKANSNHWPVRWWRTLAKLKFLMEHRYSTLEPFYYIVRNKIMEEVERCTALEAAGDAEPVKQLQIVKIDTSSGMGVSNSSLRPSPEVIGTTITVPSNRMKRGASMASNSGVLQKRVKCSPSPPTTYVERCADVDHSAREDAMCELELDAYYLLKVMQKYPDSYMPCAEQDKAKAWQNITKDIRASDKICRSTFKRALINYRLYLSRDPGNRCRLNQKYYSPLHEILRQFKMPRRLSVRSPGELNLMAKNGSCIGGGPLASDDNIEIFFPDRFIVDINMATCKPSLVMKNWAYAVGCLTSGNQRFMEVPLRSIFDKYKDKVQRE